MDLGVRHIRTAGKGSGSIELTLPTHLRDLVGLPCRIMLRDGSRPDIVLQPDLQRAQRAFTDIWIAMSIALLHENAGTPTLPLSAFAFGLHPRSSGSDMPFLSWCDGLALATPAPHDPCAISRTFAAFGQAMAAFLHIDPALAPGFGATCGYLVSGVPPTSDGQEACDLTAVAFQLASPSSTDFGDTIPAAGIPYCAATAFADSILGSEFWHRATPLLIAAADLFINWTADPSGHAVARAAWRRGRAIEMSGD